MMHAIHAWKYEYASFLSSHFAALMVKYGALEFLETIRSEHPIFVPIPMARRKERRRGYNPAEHLARELAMRTNIPVARLLVKSRNTDAQVGLSRTQRIQNLRVAFSMNPKISNIRSIQSVVLVDDVFTTGATLHACASVLTRAMPRVRIRAMILASNNHDATF